MSAHDPVSDDIFMIGGTPLDVGALLGRLASPGYGAIASFLGSVRSPNAGKRVSYIDYEGYETMMEQEMRRLAVQLRERRAVGRLALAHRLGRLRPGELSLVVAVASPHRREALDACRELVEGLKARLPVWKYEVGEAGEGFVAGRSDAGPIL